jgi:hypothetical protein
VLKTDYPGIRGKRKAVLRFGEAIPVPKERSDGITVESWTDLVEGRVQGLLDRINSENRS